jgi:aminoglycoside phosphotransferase family enzyme/predicted kinase
MNDEVAGAPSPWAACRETHISAVFLVGDRALKIKKPVRMDFLDYSTVDLRRSACEAELELNRRLSPDVYLEVAHVPLVESGPGEPIVVMRRLSYNDQLGHRLEHGPVVSDGEVRALAKCIATFHSECAVERQTDSAGGWAAAHEAWLRECDELDTLGDDVAPAADRIELRLLGLRYLDGRKSLLEKRIVAGHVREGHGDLRCDHIYFTSDGPRVIDCVDFDRSFRVADVVSDVAFLAMDLERRGAPALARQFLAAYREFSAETYPESLLDFYIAFRAIVRAKVEALRARQLRSAPAPDHSKLIGLAITHLRQAIPLMIVIGGLPSSGKTTISDAYAAAAGAVHISSDEIRHGWQDVEATGEATDDWEAGAYAPAKTACVYDELIRRAHTALANGWSVILDASWRSAEERDRARRLGRDTWVTSLEVLCAVEDHIAYPRLTRTRKGYSQAGIAVRKRMIERYGPWPTATVIPTGGSVTEALDQLVALGAAAREGAMSHPDASANLTSRQVTGHGLSARASRSTFRGRAFGGAGYRRPRHTR